MPTLSSPLITAVVLTYNKSEYTRLCLEGIIRTDYRPLEIVVVDNGSTDGVGRVVEEARARGASTGVELHFIQNSENLGAPAARNQGIEAGRGDLFLFIDNDAVPFNKQWLGIMQQQLLEQPNAAIVSARLLYPFLPHRVQFAGCGISSTGRVKYIGRGADRTDPAFLGSSEVQCLISACILCDGDIIRRVGGFDTAFFPVQYEDLDLSYRIREMGYRCYIAGAAEVYHFENTTTDGSADINFRYVTIKNGMLFKQRWKHRFERENGPADSDTNWLKLEQRSLAQMVDWDPWEDAGRRL